MVMLIRIRNRTMTNDELSKKYKKLKKEVTQLYGFLSLHEYERLTKDIDTTYQNELKKIVNR